MVGVKSNHFIVDWYMTYEHWSTDCVWSMVNSDRTLLLLILEHKSQVQDANRCEHRLTSVYIYIYCIDMYVCVYIYIFIKVYNLNDTL